MTLGVSGCASAKKPAPERRRPQPEDQGKPAPEPKPIETRPLNLGETHVESTVQEPVALTGDVEITTWANDVIRGRLVEETDSAYVLDTAPLDSGKPKLRRVPRAAVMTITKRSREP